MPPSLDQLAALDAIERTGSFAAAGRELHLTTSGISYSVRALEDGIGLTLFDRSGHRATLTAAGRRLLVEARAVLETVRRLEAVASHLETGWESTLTVVVDGVLPQAPIMRAFKRFAEARLPTRVRLFVEYLAGVRERFEDDDADLMLVLDFEGDRDHVARALPQVPMVLLCHADHPLAAVERVTRAELAEHVELVVEDSSRAPAPEPRLSLGADHVFRLSDFSSKRGALTSGVGYGWMPEHLVGEDLSAGRLVRVGFEEGDALAFTPRMVRRRSRPLGPAAARFVTLLEAELGLAV